MRLPAFKPFHALFNDLPGRLSSSSSTVPVLSDQQKDDVYYLQTQTGRAQPWLVVSTTFHDARLVDSEYQSRKSYEQLVKMQILSPVGEISLDPMDKKGFGGEIMSRLSIIPAIKIKMIIDFLFWWVEETQRLKKLFADKEELTSVLKTEDLSHEQRDHMTLLLERTKKRILLFPSKRNTAIESDGPLVTALGPATGEPPAYTR